jgi:hypothetical protein
MYAMDFYTTFQYWDNNTRTDYGMNQYVAWYLFAGIEQFVESIDMIPQCETILEELDRLEQWDKKYGGFYSPERYAELAARVRDIRAYMNREYFYLVESDDEDQQSGRETQPPPGGDTSGSEASK